MRNGFEWLRIVTPLLSGLTLFLLTQVYLDMRDLNQRVFQHMTNAEIHISHSELVELKRDLREFINQVHRSQNQ